MSRLFNSSHMLYNVFRTFIYPLLWTNRWIICECMLRICFLTLSHLLELSTITCAISGIPLPPTAIFAIIWIYGKKYWWRSVTTNDFITNMHSSIALLALTTTSFIVPRMWQFPYQLPLSTTATTKTIATSTPLSFVAADGTPVPRMFVVLYYIMYTYVTLACVIALNAMLHTTRLGTYIAHLLPESVCFRKPGLFLQGASTSTSTAATTTTTTPSSSSSSVTPCGRTQKKKRALCYFLCAVGSILVASFRYTTAFTPLFFSFSSSSSSSTGATPVLALVVHRLACVFGVMTLCRELVEIAIDRPWKKKKRRTSKRSNKAAAAAAPSTTSDLPPALQSFVDEVLQPSNGLRPPSDEERTYIFLEISAVGYIVPFCIYILTCILLVIAAVAAGKNPADIYTSFNLMKQWSLIYMFAIALCWTLSPWTAILKTHLPESHIYERGRMWFSRIFYMMHCLRSVCLMCCLFWRQDQLSLGCVLSISWPIVTMFHYGTYQEMQNLNFWKDIDQHVNHMPMLLANVMSQFH